MPEPSQPPSRPLAIPAVLWPVILGGIGFVTGFVGPILFNPEANQGPLLGIFILGPGSAILGLVLYVVCRTLGFTARTQRNILLIASIGVFVVGLSFCFPRPELQGTVVEADIKDCQPPAKVIDAAIDYWQGQIAHVTWARPRSGWQEDERQKAAASEGVVLRVSALRQNAIHKNRKPWNNRTSASGWRTGIEEKSYYAEYAGNSCADYPVGKRLLLYSPYDLSGMNRGAEDWPPRKLSDFLNLPILELLPEDYRKMLSE
jgi:hypothetical protein